MLPSQLLTRSPESDFVDLEVDQFRRLLFLSRQFFLHLPPEVFLPQSASFVQPGLHNRSRARDGGKEKAKTTRLLPSLLEGASSWIEERLSY